MHSKLKIGNQWGISIVQVLVAISIFSVLALGIVGTLSQLYESVHSISLSGNAESLRQGIQLMLASPKLCAQNFQTYTLPAGWKEVAVGTLGISGGAPLAKTGAAVNGLFAKSIKLVYQSGPFAEVFQNPGGGVVNVKRWYATLELEMLKDAPAGTQNFGGNALRPQVFYISLLTDNAGKITACNGGLDDDFMQDTCVSGFGGQWDPAKVPRCMLPVVGVGTRLSATHPDYADGIGKTVIETSTGQSALTLKGASDAGLTYSAIYLGSFSAAKATANSWVMSFVNGTAPGSPGPPNSFVIGRWKGGMTDALVITDGAPHNVGINNALPTKPLDVIGAAKISGTLELGGAATGPSFITPSDATLKDNIAPLARERADGIQKLQAYTFTMKADAEKHVHLGYLAQEVARVYPESVETTPDGHLGVNYPMLIAPLSEYAKSTRAMVEQLRQENLQLRRRLDKLERSACAK